MTKDGKSSKFCSLCKRELPLNMFPVEKGKYREHCLACKKLKVKTEDQLRDKRRRFLKHQKEFDTRHEQRKVPGTSEYKFYLDKMKHLYDLSEEAIRDQMDVQKGCCGACGTSLYFPETTNYPFPDKELLCTSCSIVLGYSLHSIPRLEGVADYIRRHNA